MHYSKLTDRIAGEGSAAWDLHFEAMRRKAAGEPVIVLSVGDPDFETPTQVVDAAVASLRAGDTHYAEILGISRLRKAIADRFVQRSGMAAGSENVAVLAGGQCALFSVVQCLLDPDDEVLVIDPTYVTYEGVFGACGARTVKVPAKAKHDFVVQPKDIAAAITPRTRALLINSPHNPTGSVIPRDIWLEIAELCCKHDLWLISDEVYSELIFAGDHLSPATLPGMVQRTATINSLSKSHAMTGWRLGWVIGPPALIDHLGNLGLSMLYGCPEFIQKAACVALESELVQTVHMRLEYLARSQAVCDALAKATGLRAFVPQAGMFVMVDIRQTGLSSQQFAGRLMQDYAVSVLSGEAFGLQTTGYVRIGLVEPVPVLQEACRRLCALALDLISEVKNGQ